VLADAQHGLQTAVLGLIALGQCVDLVLHLGDFLVRFGRRQPGTTAAGPSQLVHDALARGLPELIAAKHAIAVGVYLVEDTVGLIALGKAALVKECIQGFLRLRLRAVQSLVRAVAVLADAQHGLQTAVLGLIALGKAALVKECIQGFLGLRLRAVQSLVRAAAVLADAQHGLQTAVLGRSQKRLHRQLADRFCLLVGGAAARLPLLGTDAGNA